MLCLKVIDCLQLPYQPCGIYIGASNIKHIHQEHPIIYDAYLQDIPDIIQHPDYIGVHPRQGGVEYVKRYEQGIMVSVRLSSKGVLYVRSLYEVSEENIQAYLRHGTLIPYPEENPEENP